VTDFNAMPRIKELIELGRQCYELANATLNPEAKKALQDIDAKYAQKADELRRIEIIQAKFPKDN